MTGVQTCALPIMATIPRTRRIIPISVFVFIWPIFYGAPVRFVICWLQWLPSLNDPDQDHDNGNHQQDMNETADGVGRNQSQEPGDDQNESQCIEHRMHSG